MRRITHAFWVVFALIFLFEAWLWEKLAPIVAFIVSFIPLRYIKAKIATWIEGLRFFHHGQWLAGVGALVFAKVAGLGVTAFVFEITRPKLLQLPWFARLYELVMRGLAWAHAMVDPIKRRMRKYVYVLRPRNAGRFYRHLMRVRRRMQQQAAPAE